MAAMCREAVRWPAPFADSLHEECLLLQAADYFDVPLF
jgi:hypothetical protein